MDHDLMLSCVIMHRANGISDSPPSTLETCVQRPEFLGKLSILDSVCREHLNFGLLLSVSSVP